MNELNLKKARLIVNKSGGTAGSGGVTFRATLPTNWIRDMGLSEDDRDIELIYDAETKEISIRKEVVCCIKCGNQAINQMTSEDANSKTTSKYYKCEKCNIYFKKVFKGKKKELIEEKEVDKSEVLFI